MIKSLYNIEGYLTKSINKSDTRLYVNNELQQYLRFNLQGYQAYASIYDGCDLEIILIKEVRETYLIVARAQELTEAHSFAADSLIEYTLTVAEVQSKIHKQPLALYNLGAITLENQIVGYIMPNFEERNASEVIISDNVIHIERREGAYGCCGCEPNYALPHIEYLTTTVYPLYDLQGMSSDVRSGFRVYPQPVVLDTMAANLELLSLEVYGQQTSFSNVEWMQSNIEIISLDVYGKSITLGGVYEWMQSDIELVSVEVYGKQVAYKDTQWMQSNIELIGITLYV